MTDYRVLVTGNNDENESRIASSAPIKVDNYFVYQPGFSVEVFWRTSANSTVGGAFKFPTWDTSSTLPEVAGTSAMIVTFPPTADTKSLEPIDIENITKEVSERLPGLAETFEPEPPGYHLTDTIDYVVLLEGQLKLFLDNDESVDLKVGDVIVQNGTRHAWVNDSKNPARLLVIMVGAQRIEY
ncbi:MAG: cupin domain-containing protein [Colwellia sp.]|nr:cupin domain-containing protein [Colwellia sp.]